MNSDVSKKGGQSEEKVSGKRLVKILKSQNLHNIIKEPTRITQKTQTLIDLFITSKKELIQESGVIHLGISDHSLIYGVYKILVEKEKPVFKKVKNFKGMDLAAFNKSLEDAPWSVCSVFEDVDGHVWAWENCTKIQLTSIYLQDK